MVATAESGVANYCHRVVRIADGRAIDDAPVPRRRVIPAARIPGTSPGSHERQVVVCTRCNYGNFSDAAHCSRCEFPLELTKEEEQSIEGRLSCTDTRWLGVESSSDEGEVAGQELMGELKEVPFFTGLGRKSLAKILSSMEVKRFGQGSVMIKQGDPGDAFYIVRSGQVQVVLRRKDQPDIQVAELGPKEGFGEMALFTDQPRSASVVAMTDVQVWRLPKAAFEELVSEHLSLALYFNRILSQRLRALQDRVMPYL